MSTPAAPPDIANGKSPTEVPAPTPPPPELVEAFAAFEHGDLHSAADRVRRVLAANPSPTVADPARDLLDRIATDEWAIRIGFAALGLLIIVAVVYSR